jgi:hypothetical protein
MGARSANAAHNYLNLRHILCAICGICLSDGQKVTTEEQRGTEPVCSPASCVRTPGRSPRRDGPPNYREHPRCQIAPSRCGGIVPDAHPDRARGHRMAAQQVSNILRRTN